MKLTMRWIGAVKMMMIKAYVRVGGWTGRLKRSAINMKSSWSDTGKCAPDLRFIRRLMKDPSKSPIKAPRDRANPRTTLPLGSPTLGP